MAQDQNQDIDLGMTRVDMGREQTAVLTVRTSKRSDGGLSSDATVYWVGDQSRTHTFGFGGGGDFSKRLHRSGREVRATQKNIDRQHADVFTADVVASLTAAARQYYGQAAAA